MEQNNPAKPGIVTSNLDNLDLDITELDARLEMASAMPDWWIGGGRE